MKKLTLTLICFIVLFSCQTKEQNKGIIQHKSSKTYAEIITEQLALNSADNNIFLNFELGSTQKQAKSHIDQLIKEKKIKNLSTWDLTFARVEGYPYEIQLNDSTTCSCAISDEFFDNKLYKLTLLVFGDCTTMDLKIFLTKVYGESNFEELSKEKYSEEKKFYWISGNKEILLTKIASFNAIEFTDLRLKIKDEKYKATLDTLKTKIGKEKAMKTEADFK